MTLMRPPGTGGRVYCRSPLVGTAGEIEMTSDGRPAGIVLAAKNSSHDFQRWANEDNLVCDGVNDETQIHSAMVLARSASTGNARKTIWVADGTYTTDWQPTVYDTGNGGYGRGGNWYSSIRGVITTGTGTTNRVNLRAVNRRKPVIRSVLQPGNFNNNYAGGQAGYYNSFVDIPGTETAGGGKSNLWLDGLVFDGRAYAQINANNASNKSWMMDGVREWKSPEFLMTHCSSINMRGTDGSGPGETSGISIKLGRLEDCIVEQVDGGNAATLYHHHQVSSSETSGTMLRCEARGGATGNTRGNHGFAQYGARNADRIDCTATDLRGSGFRSEVSAGSTDTNCDTYRARWGHLIQHTDNATWLNCTSFNHGTGAGAISSGSGWGVWINMAYGFQVTDHTISGTRNGPDVHFGRFPGAGPGVYNNGTGWPEYQNRMESTGNFLRLTSNGTRSSSSSPYVPTWSNFGL